MRLTNFEITDASRQYVASAEFAFELRAHIYFLGLSGTKGFHFSVLTIAFIAWALSGHDIKTVPTDREVPLLHAFVGEHADEIFAATEDIEDGIELVLFSAEEGN
jgi:hypothetical protein